MGKYIINGKFLTQNITGVQRYAREIIAELDKIIKNEEIFLGIPIGDFDIPDYKNIKVIPIKGGNGTLWEQTAFPIYAIRKKLLPINLCGPSPLLLPGIVVLHDVTFKVVPENFNNTFKIWYEIMYRNAIKRAKNIITISNFSDVEIRKYYPTDRIFNVISNGWQHFNKIKFSENILNKYGLEKYSFNFALSSLKTSKNFQWIAEIAKNNPNEVFVIAGSINNKVFTNGFGFILPDNMKFLGYISDEEAKTLMRDCKAFLFPSLYEGFGIPPLEAMSAGCRTIVVSDIPVMREIFGNSVKYIDPLKYDYNLNELISDKKCGFDEVLNRYSWKKSAINLKKIITD